MRILAACSLGGSGHWQPLVPLLRAAQRRGDEVLVAGPHALSVVDSDLFRRTPMWKRGSINKMCSHRLMSSLPRRVRDSAWRAKRGLALGPSSYVR